MDTVMNTLRNIESWASLTIWPAIFLLIVALLTFRRRNMVLKNAARNYQSVRAWQESSRTSFLVWLLVFVGGRSVANYYSRLIGDALSVAGASGIVLSILVLPYLRRKKYKRLVIGNNYRVCLDCHYSLQGHGSKGVCPECGREFDEANLRREWRRLMGFKQMAP